MALDVPIRIRIPFDDENEKTLKVSEMDSSGDKRVITELTAGQWVLLSGTLYTARDAAHKRLLTAIQAKEPLPFKLSGSVIYYAGPCPARPGNIIGSIGPTTSGRMDPYTPWLISLGLKGMIGKGKRNREVREAIARNGAVYFVTIGGAGALLSKTVLKAEVIAYQDLGPEAISKLEVKDFPAIVAIDSTGKDIYDVVRKR